MIVWGYFNGKLIIGQGLAQLFLFKQLIVSGVVLIGLLQVKCLHHLQYKLITNIIMFLLPLIFIFVLDVTLIVQYVQVMLIQLVVNVILDIFSLEQLVLIIVELENGEIFQTIDAHFVVYLV
jgi:hypothetical protein